MTAPLERNLKLIPWHELLVRANPWIAVFVLFTRSRFGLDGAIQLAGIYYLAVVVFEVPSGWLSDRLGRTPTLRLTSVAWIASFSLYLIGDDRFWLLAAGQVFLAVGYAALSGTDVTFHYDTLEALGRADEYADRQANVAARALVVAGAGALIGGALGLVDIRLAFALSLILAFVQLAIAWLFAEPPRESGQAENIVGQVLQCLRYLKNLPLAWVFGYGVAMVVLEHVAFTLLQPWLTEALGQSSADLGATPLVSGATVAATALIGSVFARYSARLGKRFGLRLVLVGLGTVSALIVSAMAASTLPVVLLLVAFRSAQGSAAPILISAAVAPEVAREHRATFLSLDSLAGRLSYGGLLLVVSTDAADDVRGVLTNLAAVSWVLVVLTAVTALLVKPTRYEAGI